MPGRCPGMDSRNLKVSLHRCPECGAEVEIFSDELRVRCQRCGTPVYREAAPACISWCASARQCLGEQRWQELQENQEKRNEK